MSESGTEASSDARVVSPPTAPWTFRVFEQLPVPPALASVALAALLIVFYFVVEYARGEVSLVLAGQAADHIPKHFRTAPINVLLLAYVLSALCYLARLTRQNVDELRPLLRSGQSSDALGLEPVDIESTPRGRAAAAAGVFALLFFFFFLPGTFLSMFSASHWVFEHAFENALIVPLGWLTGRFLYGVVERARRMSHLAYRLESIDLFDLSVLAPFARQGLSSALLAVLYLSISSGHIGNILISPVGLLGMGLTTVGVATAALVWPMRGVHQRIRERKQEKLQEVRAEIRASEQAVLGEAASARDASARLPALLALEARVDSVREWPFDASSLLRFAFYVMLGIGSWLGGAAVERLLDVALS